MHRTWQRWITTGMVLAGIGIASSGSWMGDASAAIGEWRMVVRPNAVKGQDSSRKLAEEPRSQVGPRLVRSGSAASVDHATRTSPNARGRTRLAGRQRAESTQPVVAPEVDEIVIPGVEEFENGPPSAPPSRSRLRTSR